MMNYQRIILVSTGSFAVGWAIAFFGSLYIASQRIIAALPAQTRSCLPLQGVALAAANPQVVAEASFKAIDYYLFHLKDDANEYVVLVTQDGQCHLKQFSPDAALSSQIPLSVAQRLTLEKLEKAIAQVGKTQFKKQIQQVMRSSPGQALSPEMQWAIEALGLRSG
jgi:hypothetical protein